MSTISEAVPSCKNKYPFYLASPVPKEDAKNKCQ